MLATIMALLGGIGGAAARILPEIIEAWKHRNDPANELELAKIELEKTKAELQNKLELAQTRAQFTEAQALAVAAIAQSKAAVIAQQAQAKLTGIPFVDGANLLVRPVVTLWLLTLYTLYKVLTVWAAVTQHATLDDVAGAMWTPDDIAIFSGAITFWFVDQSIASRVPTPTIPAPPKV
jgi:hypothetical protein